MVNYSLPRARFLKKHDGAAGLKEGCYFSTIPDRYYDSECLQVSSLGCLSSNPAHIRHTILIVKSTDMVFQRSLPQYIPNAVLRACFFLENAANRQQSVLQYLLLHNLLCCFEGM